MAGLEDLFFRPKDVPAESEVYKRVQHRLKRLAEVRTLIHNAKKNDEDLLNELPEFYSELFLVANPDTPFRLDTLSSAEQVRRELQEARTWLLYIITLQGRHLPKENMIRLLRFAVKKDKSEWTDIDTLYMMLTDEKQDDAKGRLTYTFAVVLHYQYASRHAHVLGRLQEHEARRIRRIYIGPPRSSKANREAVRGRIMEKVQSTKVDNFACAIPMASVLSVASDAERACPVCRNDYLDFDSFNIFDLIADYPVRIKYCGHVLGKSCLETWMGTPLPDPAKYPHRTCPLCRTQIEFEDQEDEDGGKSIEPLSCVQAHVETDTEAMKLADRLGLDDEECVDVILRLISEEIVCEELLGEVEGRLTRDGEERDCLAKAKPILGKMLAELKEEKDMWGFGKKGEEWAEAKEQWAQMAANVHVKTWC